MGFSKIILVIARGETGSRETLKEAILTPRRGMRVAWNWMVAMVLEENAHIWEIGWAGFGVRGELRTVSRIVLGFQAQSAQG